MTPSGTFFWLPWPSLGHKNTVRVLVKLVFDNPHLSPHPTCVSEIEIYKRSESEISKNNREMNGKMDNKKGSKKDSEMDRGMDSEKTAK